MMMIATIAAVGITFASVTMMLAAVGMFLRDLFAKPASTARQRLIFAPEEPEGDINRSFFRLVEESGSTLDMQTALAVVIGSGIIGAAAPLAMFDNLLAAAGGLILGVVIRFSISCSFVGAWEACAAFARPASDRGRRAAARR
jgi:hypothetical protein